MPAPSTCACHNNGPDAACDYPNGCDSRGGCCAPRCSTCRRESEVAICPACVKRAATQLAEIPSLLDRLAYTAVTAPAGLGDYVSGGSFSSRPPLVLDALSLTATTTMAIGLALVDPQPPVDERGNSIPWWITSWAAVWRQRWAHHQPEGRRARHRVELRERQDEYGARVVLGLAKARARVPDVPDPTVPEAWQLIDHGEEADDVIAEHWHARFGDRRQVHRLVGDLAYLRTWLDRAVVEFDDGPLFVAGLRSLVAAARAAVGERSDVFVLGQCPVPILNRETGFEAPCGAMLARDAFSSVVVCPRCKTETAERGLLQLAGAIRRVWGTLAGREAWTG
jgi:hypothetical protein